QQSKFETQQSKFKTQQSKFETQQSKFKTQQYKQETQAISIGKHPFLADFLLKSLKTSLFSVNRQ
ncbi:MAG: hypothetical protein ACYDEC_15975, partial [Bacteroidia bacterium]